MQKISYEILNINNAPVYKHITHAFVHLTVHIFLAMTYPYGESGADEDRGGFAWIEHLEVCLDIEKQRLIFASNNICQAFPFLVGEAILTPFDDVLTDGPHFTENFDEFLEMVRKSR